MNVHGDTSGVIGLCALLAFLAFLVFMTKEEQSFSRYLLSIAGSVAGNVSSVIVITHFLRTSGWFLSNLISRNGPQRATTLITRLSRSAWHSVTHSRPRSRGRHDGNAILGPITIRIGLKTEIKTTKALTQEPRYLEQHQLMKTQNLRSGDFYLNWIFKENECVFKS